MIALAVALVSAATLAFQVLLVRVFAIEQFHHFAYMAIGVAMLGIGACGAAVALRGRLRADGAERRFALSTIAATASLVTAPMLLDLVSVDPTRLLWDSSQWPRLGLLYLVLALPFGLGALPTLLALAGSPTRPGVIYGASFLGSGLGAIASLVVLTGADPARALGIAGILAGLGAIAGSARRPVGRAVQMGSGAAALAALALFAARPGRLDLLPAKGLTQVEALPEAERLGERPHPAGWLVAVRAPAFRFAPGLSLAYRGTFPAQTAVFVDGDLVGAATAWDEPGATDLLRWLPASLPYALGPRRRILVLGAGGAPELPLALLSGADAVTAVEVHPEVARLTSPDVPESTSLRWVIGDARAHVARDRARYDLISIGAAGGPGTTASGLQALSEDFVHTREAYSQYLARLDGDGVLAVTSWLEVPPRGAVRVVLTAADALRRLDPLAPGRGLVVVRGWGTVTTLVKPDGFSPDQVRALEHWAEERWFDLDWRPGLDRPTQRFNFVDQPTLFEAARAASAGATEAERFAAAFPFRVAPATDRRPYPFHFSRATSLAPPAEWESGAWLPLAEWGYLALLATLAQSASVGALMLAIPALAWWRRKRTGATATAPHGTANGAGRAGGAGAAGGLGRLVLYFCAIGFGYLAAEIALIQELTLLLGDPIYAVTATLAALLVSSGIGSTVSGRLAPRRGAAATLLLAAVLAGLGFSLLPLVHLLQPLAPAGRVALAAALVAPLGLVMGLPFPLGLRALGRGEPIRASWAWAANGFASVVAAPLAALIALEAGSGALFAAAGAGYVVAAAATRAASHPAS